MNKLLPLTALTLVLAASSASAATYFLDFQAAGQVTANGFTAFTVPNFHQLQSPSQLLAPNGPTLSITAVDNYGFGSTTNPLVGDGFFVSGATLSSNPDSGKFILANLNPGDLVSLYAIAAWDTNGRGALVSLNGGPLVDTATAPDDGFNGSIPGPSPTISDLALIASNVPVGLSGSLDGLISYAQTVAKAKSAA